MRQSTAAFIRNGERLLFVRRRAGGDLSECWELPGGKVDPGESPQEALQRELHEELGIDASVGERVGRTEFDHRGQRFELVGFEVEADLGPLVLREHEAHAFYTINNALRLRLAPSDASLLQRVR